LKTLFEVIAVIFSVALVFVAFAAVFALVTQWAWSVVIVPIFGLKELTLIQAFALNLLSSLLIKSSLTAPKK